ncbi:alpha/beta hydrolase [Herbaspirillum sp. RV1423]|uniref:alpha/beta hydrolase n=1 Tax=Herbaspirillum sp. RV1423 TaxID=1443993 RepID=UPI0004B022C1|nr:alpha/beta hydrolase [Herbaspirillum sp. RV1423]
MNAHTQSFLIPGAVGQLECALDLPDPEQFAAPRGLALVAHPHPLFGGTMDNKVAQTLARSFLALGYVAVRMNFRGVGKSEGEHDHGKGETDDMALLLAHMRGQYPDLPLALGGFSFGTFVQAQLQQRLIAEGTPAERLALVGTAAGKWPMPDVPADTILIHGELDDTIPLSAVFDWARPQELPVIVIPGADHFFHRKLQHIKNLIVQMWHR